MNLPGVVVDPVLRSCDFFLGHIGKVRSFGMTSANHAIHILIAAPLPRGIRVAVVHLRPLAVDRQERSISSAIANSVPLSTVMLLYIVPNFSAAKLPFYGIQCPHGSFPHGGSERG